MHWTTLHQFAWHKSTQCLDKGLGIPFQIRKKNNTSTVSTSLRQITPQSEGRGVSDKAPLFFAAEKLHRMRRYQSVGRYLITTSQDTFMTVEETGHREASSFGKTFTWSCWCVYVRDCLSLVNLGNGWWITSNKKLKVCQLAHCVLQDEWVEKVSCGLS